MATGALCITGNGIALYRWLAVKHAITLEQATGMRSRTFHAAKGRLCEELGLPRRAKLATMLAAVEAKIAVVGATVKPGDVEEV